MAAGAPPHLPPAQLRRLLAGSCRRTAGRQSHHPSGGPAGTQPCCLPGCTHGQGKDRVDVRRLGRKPKVRRVLLCAPPSCHEARTPHLPTAVPERGVAQPLLAADGGRLGCFGLHSLDAATLASASASAVSCSACGISFSTLLVPACAASAAAPGCAACSWAPGAARVRWLVEGHLGATLLSCCCSRTL